MRTQHLQRPADTDGMKPLPADFLRDRDAALRSMDEAVIRAYCAKHRIKVPDDPAVFWYAIQKARAALGM